MKDKDYGQVVLNKLNENFPNLKCELNYNNNFELIVAVILSAQCTDKRVNKITPMLFSILKSPEDINKISVLEIENIIKSCGLFKNKANNIYNMCKKLNMEYGGVVPQNMKDLTSLPGVGRKSASVVLAVGYQVPSVPVDTHVFRVSNRLGLTKAKNVLESEKQLKKIFLEKDWIKLHYLFVHLGRYVCKARGYDCSKCVLKELCKFDKKQFK